MTEKQILEKAESFGTEKKWTEALATYQTLSAPWRASADGQHRLALCFYEIGDYAAALACAVKSARLDESRWETKYLIAKSLRMNGRLPEALKLLATLHRNHPEINTISRDYGDFVCKVLGDWSTSKQLWVTLENDKDYQKDARWFGIKERIYDGTDDLVRLVEDIRTYSETWLTLNLAPLPGKRQNASPLKRLRVGLISTFFRATPLYYLCFSPLQLLKDEIDWVIYNRETVEDWATDKFRAIACEWHEVKHLSAEQLALRLQNDHLDVMVDMCGWLDQQVLQALSSRPVPRLYKWVGGQATSTGLRCFDGFITDEYQSPPELATFYTEPLIFLPSGYATYTAPDYLPAPLAKAGRGHWKVGIIAHPMKVSAPFLRFLRQEIEQLGTQPGFHIELQFIGWRYGLSALQQQLLSALSPACEQARGWLDISFMPTRGHAQFLARLADLDWVIDTFPYTGGLTALECLAVGVPYRTRSGTLFCQRHAYSHARFANIEPEAFDLDTLGAFTPPATPKTGKSLLPATCPRMDHAGLANALLKVLCQA